jgi:hypothetical protein
MRPFVDTQGHDYAPKIRFPALRDSACAGIDYVDLRFV